KFYDFDAEGRAKALKGYDISEDFGAVPTPETRKLLANYKMRLLPAAHGFTVAVKVTPSSSGGNKVFIPAIPLEEGLKLRFRIRIRRPGLYNYTSTPLLPSLKAQYFLSNLTAGAEAEFPSLSRNVPKYLKDKQYEMGELAVERNRLYEAVARTKTRPKASAADWSQIDDYRYLNEGDRLLTHYVLQYSFAFGAAVTSATFSLKNAGGDVVAEKEVQKESPILSYTWDLSDLFEPSPFDPDKELLPEGPYTLEVSGNNNYADSKNLLIDSRLSGAKADPALARQARETFIVVEVGHGAGLGDFRLLEPEGHLRMENVGGQLQPVPPQFEVRLRNRNTYWNYIWHPQQSEKPATPYVDVQADPDDDSRLITPEPQPLTRFPSTILLKDTVKLPNPETPALSAKPDGRICSEVFLPKMPV
ncbi:MAG: hypothetical protein KDD06_03745, partial [Phaeodactylibacter sp.]|nr:hypothetical protein [Phaeodactylibacter sp.]